MYRSLCNVYPHHEMPFYARSNTVCKCRRLCNVCCCLGTPVYAVPRTVLMLSVLLPFVQATKLQFIHFQGLWPWTEYCVKYLYTRKCFDVHMRRRLSQVCAWRETTGCTCLMSMHMHRCLFNACPRLETPFCLWLTSVCMRRKLCIGCTCLDSQVCALTSTISMCRR